MEQLQDLLRDHLHIYYLERDLNPSLKNNHTRHYIHAQEINEKYQQALREEFPDAVSIETLHAFEKIVDYLTDLYSKQRLTETKQERIDSAPIERLPEKKSRTIIW